MGGFSNFNGFPGPSAPPRSERELLDEFNTEAFLDKMDQQARDEREAAARSQFSERFPEAPGPRPAWAVQPAAAVAPSPAAPPAPKPAAPPPSVTAPLNPKHADKPGPWRDRYVTDGPPSMPGAAAAAPATPAPAARRRPIRMIRGADGSMKFTNVGDEGEIAVDNGVSTDWATKAGAPSAGTFTQPAVSDVAMVPDYVLENADRSARLLQAQRMIERLQAGPNVGPAHATAGEQLETQRQTASKESLRQDRDSALGMLSNQLASREITPERYAELKLEVERAYGIDAGVDPRFYSRPY